MLTKNFTDINNRIAAAASSSGRSPAGIKLVAVVKRVPLENVIAAVNAGHDVFGENYVQEALTKIPSIKMLASQKIAFHFIGKLQSNKAQKAVELFDVIETVDSLKLGMALERHCVALDKSLEAYLQVNIASEPQKSGLHPKDCETVLKGLSHCQRLLITGLMTMPPYFSEPENVRPYFKQLRLLSEELTAKGLLGRHGPVELSMGMSGDFEVAIEEGATVVRIGTALFGSRTR